MATSLDPKMLVRCVYAASNASFQNLGTGEDKEKLVLICQCPGGYGDTSSLVDSSSVGRSTALIIKAYIVISDRQ
ncbi:hypothetical protein L2E82_18804 [Cichorium intybus]|uniref:Uncharacterized protein n=1 Tax=Cichorium intybus TaxID=13427 RepID=A0ACB9FBG9_CICIN|nr:hypothetical protein L2E82_18804 [Cichorium intybus]